MASKGDESTGKDEGEVKISTAVNFIYKPRGNLKVAPPLVSSTDTKGTKLYIFIFYTVLFPFLTIVDEKIFLSKACLEESA